jgi:hypothetical protein
VTIYAHTITVDRDPIDERYLLTESLITTEPRETLGQLMYYLGKPISSFKGIWYPPPADLKPVPTEYVSYEPGTDGLTRIEVRGFPIPKGMSHSPTFWVAIKGTEGQELRSA